MVSRKIILATPRGFCAGVNRAIEIVDIALKLYKAPIYVNHEIVHNKYVVDNFKKKGVIFIEDLEAIPEKATVIFSAHGVPPKTWDIAKNKKFNTIDATCPLVTKVHLEALRYAQKGYHIILIGHKSHVETIGTSSEAPHVTTIIENINEVERLSFPSEQQLVYLTQTTLSVYDTQNIVSALKAKFPQIEAPSKNDICYATTNRQDVIQKMSSYINVLLVIGSKNSSNSNRLKELGESLNVPSYLIEDKQSIKIGWFDERMLTIGITAGASVPEKLVQETIEYLQTCLNINNITEYRSVEENVTFKIPKKLTTLQNA